MPDILIRDLPDHVVAGLDAQARRLGLSRNEYLRRRLVVDAHPELPRPRATVEDLQRLATLVSDVTDPEVMAGAWD